jgi:glutamate formiminotransferase/formiminotetrahydrofolate cyclodeaminase
VPATDAPELEDAVGVGQEAVDAVGLVERVAGRERVAGVETEADARGGRGALAHRAQLLEAMAEHGNPASASDAGVGALAARAAVRGAWLNVRTNVAGLRDRSAVSEMLEGGARLDQEAAEREARILQVVERKFG